MPDGGTLIIETANVYLDEAEVHEHPRLRVGQHVMLALTDNGTGMTAEVREQIFEPFFTTKTKGHGTGLGLATVYGIVAQSGGWIWVYSEPGKGATFKLYFPQTGEALVQEPALARARLGGTETVLVVEDQDEVRRLAIKALTKYGYNVFSAANAKQAIAFCESHRGPLHLVLSDVVMPGLNGLELAKCLAVMRPDLKFLFMSGYTENAIMHHGVLDVSAKYLQKPFTPEGLAESVREVLDANEAQSTVLLVDGDSSVRTLLRRHLTGDGYAVLEAVSDSEALAIARRSQKIDLVIVDMTTLKREGAKTISGLREHHPQMKVITISGVFGEDAAHLVNRLGPASTLLKPISREALLRSVQAVLRGEIRRGKPV